MQRIERIIEERNVSSNVDEVTVLGKKRQIIKSVGSLVEYQITI